jgi:FAD/FMN-containing dehydrogenase
MTRFRDIKVDNTTATVEVGAGLTWDQVYAALDPYGVNVIGGRVPGIGVAGLTLGGGEHFLSAYIPSCNELRIAFRSFLED